MAYNINIVVLSGEIAWVKEKYSAANKHYVNFAVKHPTVILEGKEIVSRSNDYYFCSCFDEAIFRSGMIKEGNYATIQGRLSAYKTKTNAPAMSIIVEKMDVYGLERDKK